jgi:hypothetical protein
MLHQTDLSRGDPNLLVLCEATLAKPHLARTAARLIGADRTGRTELQRPAHRSCVCASVADQRRLDQCAGQS